MTASNEQLPEDMQKLLDRGNVRDPMPSEDKTELWDRIEESVDAGEIPDSLEDDPGPPEVDATGGLEGTAPSAQTAGGSAASLSGSGVIQTVLVVTIGVAAGVYYANFEAGDIERSPTKEAVSTSQSTNDKSSPVVRESSEKSPEWTPTWRVVGGDRRTTKDAEKASTTPSNTESRQSGVSFPDSTNARREGSVESSDKRTPPASPEPDPTALIAEQRLLQRAESRLADNNPEKALQLLDKHRSEYPKGQLERERKVLRIRVLHEMGKTSEARRKAEAFKRQYPDSLASEAVSKILSDETD